MVKLPVDFITLKYKDNLNFDNFFRNSFMHFYLRTKDLQNLTKETRLGIAKHRCDTICEISKFLVTTDEVDPNVFYSYVAYTVSDSQLYVHFGYVKKKVRTFGFFKKSLELLKASANQYYYTLPIKLKKKTYLPEFEKRVL